MMKAVFFVGIGGALGSVLRYGIAYFMERKAESNFPISTFLVNIIGSFLIGILIAYFSKIDNANLKLLLVTGFCGGFTTFSAFALENIKLLQSGHTLTALVYILLSVVLSVIAVWLGMMLVS